MVSDQLTLDPAHVLFVPLFPFDLLHALFFLEKRSPELLFFPHLSHFLPFFHYGIKFDLVFFLQMQKSLPPDLSDVLLVFAQDQFLQLALSCQTGLFYQHYLSLPLQNLLLPTYVQLFPFFLLEHCSRANLLKLLRFSLGLFYF